MRTTIIDCKHCGTEYTHQLSGSYDAIDTPRKYRDDRYCPECQKAIYEVLNKIYNIPKKFGYKNVPTNEVDLDTLLRWEQEHKDDYREKMKQAEAEGKVMFPMCKRVLAGSMNLDTGEREIVNEVIGREDKKGRIYIYAYWSHDKSKQRITVEKRINLLTGEELKYKLK